MQVTGAYRQRSFCLEKDHPTMLLFLAEIVILEPDEKASEVPTSAERRT